MDPKEQRQLELAALGRHFLVRERSPFKESFDTTQLTSRTRITKLAEQWGATLATAHARADRDHNPAVIPYEFEKEVQSLIGARKSQWKTRLRSVGREAPSVEVYVKLEFANPGGSVKDRAALRMIQQAMLAGELSGGKTLIDSTSGNTGVAYSLFGAALGPGEQQCRDAGQQQIDQRRRQIEGEGLAGGSRGEARLAQRVVEPQHRQQRGRLKQHQPIVAEPRQRVQEIVFWPRQVSQVTVVRPLHLPHLVMPAPLHVLQVTVSWTCSMRELLSSSWTRRSSSARFFSKKPCACAKKASQYVVLISAAD